MFNFSIYSRHFSRPLLSLMFILLAQFSTQAHSADNLILPTDNDLYSQLVQKAHAQDSTVSFRELRIAYLNSSASKLTANTLAELTKLRRDMFDAVAHTDAPVIRAKAEAILNIKYIDLDAHKLLSVDASLKMTI